MMMNGDDEERRPRPTRSEVQARARRPHGWRLAALLLVLVGGLVIIGGWVWIDGQANPSGPTGKQVLVTVPDGAGSSQFAGLLQRKGVIASSLAYRIWSKLHAASTVYAGTYALDEHESFGAIDHVLSGGPNVFSFVVPPGFTVSEVAARVGQVPGHSQSAFDRLATDGSLHSPWQPAGVTSLDGLLGTGSYRLLPGETDTELLTEMINRFNQQANALGLTADSAALGLTPYQAITVASIDQKEGVIQANIGPVARVILNRLAANMPLQMDSTVLYALGRDGGKVTANDLNTRTPYNTYLNRGLTPTPIAFPSTAALQASLHPPSGLWLYFVVVKADGTEAFADTFAQQRANEALAATRGLG